MRPHRVIGQFRDTEGKLIAPGSQDDPWTPRDQAMADRLIKARCLAKPEDSDGPFAGATNDEQSSSSPADPAQASLTLDPSQDGQPSQSTTVGESLGAQTSSTHATGDGGTTTAKKSAKSSGAKRGRKTKTPQRASDSTE